MGWGGEGRGEGEEEEEGMRKPRELFPPLHALFTLLACRLHSAAIAPLHDPLLKACGQTSRGDTSMELVPPPAAPFVPPELPPDVNRALPAETPTFAGVPPDAGEAAPDTVAPPGDMLLALEGAEAAGVAAGVATRVAGAAGGDEDPVGEGGRPAGFFFLRRKAGVDERPIDAAMPLAGLDGASGRGNGNRRAHG